jgi:hypothetical protein
MSLICSPGLFAEMITSRIRELDGRAFVFPSAVDIVQKDTSDAEILGVSFLARNNAYILDIGRLRRRLAEHPLDSHHWTHVFHKTEILASTAVRLKACVVKKDPRARLRTMSEVLNDPETPEEVRRLLMAHPQIPVLNRKVVRAEMESVKIPIMNYLLLDIGIFQHFVHYGYTHGLGYTYILSHILY